MNMFGLEGSGFIIAISVSLLLVGAVVYYFNARVAALEKKVNSLSLNNNTNTSKNISAGGKKSKSKSKSKSKDVLREIKNGSVRKAKKKQVKKNK